MADNTGRGSNNALYFIVGGLVVIAGIFLFLNSGDYFGDGTDVDVNVEAPAATPPAGEEAAPEPAPAPSQ